ncbi:PilZ domain-containing protein [Oceanisphaera avium]|uniref:PilZ domain-containing protein n=1 Tax=Oceanisphaera avium TaxID=1903694 RepID=A0A1Y0D1S5_9GAMM|nr:PilZ domain-containing protein [Oceanisphaera avium]ART81055.1 PilZ domain-containing protein [Oceanisphaera avium]
MAEPYFSIEYRAQVNLCPLAEGESVPDAERLENEIPAPFKLISEVTRIDTHNARLLRNLDEHASDLVEIINLQSRKIDLVLSYVLAHEDEAHERHHTLTLGGGGFTFMSPTPWVDGALLRFKLFLPELSVAIYGYGQIAAQSEPYHYRCDFSALREQDRDALIRASLQLQAKQLKARAERRAQRDDSISS